MLTLGMASVYNNSKCDNSIDTTSYQDWWQCVCTTEHIRMHMHTHVSLGMCIVSSSPLLHNKLPQNSGLKQTNKKYLKEEIHSNIITIGGFNYPLKSSTDYPQRKSIRKHWPYTTCYTRLYTKHSIQKQENIHSSQAYLGHSPGQITCYATKKS